MKRLLAFTAVAAFASFASSAHAATTVTLGATSSSISYASGGTLAPNVNLASLSPSQLILTGDAEVVNPAVSVPGQYVAPDGGVVYGNSFLAVIANPTPIGTATFVLSPNQHTLGFTWGSVDDFNTLVITATNATYTITGAQIASNIAGVSLGSTDEDLIFNDTAGNILSASFTSTQNSFEAANFETAVPLPAALPLFASALLGIGALVYRRRGKTA